MIRTCYRSRMRLWRGSDITTEVVWYPAEDLAPPLDKLTPFGSRIWDEIRLSNVPLGEQPIGRRGLNWRGRGRPVRGSGDSCGSDTAWANGGVFGSDPPLVLDSRGWSKCCGREAREGEGGSGAGGTGVKPQRIDSGPGVGGEAAKPPPGTRAGGGPGGTADFSPPAGLGGSGGGGSVVPVLTGTGGVGVGGVYRPSVVLLPTVNQNSPGPTSGTGTLPPINPGARDRPILDFLRFPAGVPTSPPVERRITPSEVPADWGRSLDIYSFSDGQYPATYNAGSGFVTGVRLNTWVISNIKDVAAPISFFAVKPKGQAYGPFSVPPALYAVCVHLLLRSNATSDPIGFTVSGTEPMGGPNTYVSGFFSIACRWLVHSGTGSNLIVTPAYESLADSACLVSFWEVDNG